MHTCQDIYKKTQILYQYYITIGIHTIRERERERERLTARHVLDPGAALVVNFDTRLCNLFN